MSIAYCFKEDSADKKQMLCALSKKTNDVLIVDNNKAVLRILTKILQKAGYHVSATETGNEMLKQLETQPSEVVIIDVQLEDVNGFDLLNIIQKMYPQMKKIILTSSPSSEDKIKALELGADYFLSKPIKAEKLIKIVAKAAPKT